MDPTACLQIVFDHIADGDFREARSSLADLMGWTNNGGFLPGFPGRDEPLAKSEYYGVCFALCKVVDLGMEAAKRD